MDLNEMNESWQTNAPTLAAMEKTNPFTVPEGYFGELEEQIAGRIKITQFDNNQALFTTPEGYFESLTDKIVSVTNIGQLKPEQDSGVFTVPENYFTGLEEKIKNRLEPLATGSDSKIKYLLSRWTSYAAAACITAIISFGIYFNSTGNNNDIEAQIAQIPAEDIVDYLQLYSDAGEASAIIENLEDGSELSKLSPEISEQEIEQYLELNL
ncbi:MAG: hypothetical protein H7Y13_15840 [Sphingobacteriaceae bacterium]|nr:hypothetical protein [Sphingobacteriaceae bacterium]